MADRSRDALGQALASPWCTLPLFSLVVLLDDTVVKLARTATAWLPVSLRADHCPLRSPLTFQHGVAWDTVGAYSINEYGAYPSVSL